MGAEEQILSQLSDILKQRLMIESNKVVLIDSKIFHDNFSENVISKTVSIIKEYKSTPQEVIYLKGDKDDCSIFFIKKGTVELFFYKTSPNDE